MSRHLTRTALSLSALILLTVILLSACSDILSREAEPSLSAPLLHPSEGTHQQDITVSISSPTESSVIRYTTDGSDPDYSSPVYTAAIPVSGNGTEMTIKAVAINDTGILSPVASGTYRISYAGVPDEPEEPPPEPEEPPTEPEEPQEQASAPEFTPPGYEPGSSELQDPGNHFTGDFSIYISSATPDATVHYTLDGSDPDENSPVYTDAIEIDTDIYQGVLVLKAFAVREGYQDSAISETAYYISTPPEAPQIYWIPVEENNLVFGWEPQDGLEYSGELIRESDNTVLQPDTFHTPGPWILFTDLDPAEMYRFSLEYWSQDGSSGLSSIQVRITDGHDRNTAPLVLHDGTPFAFSPVEDGLQEVSNYTEFTITSGTDNAEIYYSLDGSDPAEGGTRYNEPFTVPPDMVSGEEFTLKAVVIREGVASPAFSNHYGYRVYEDAVTLTVEGTGVSRVFLEWTTAELLIEHSVVEYSSSDGQQWNSRNPDPPESYYSDSYNMYVFPLPAVNYLFRVTVQVPSGRTYTSEVVPLQR